MESLFPIIFEDDNLLVINKPAGLVCHPTKGDAYSSLISRIRLYLGTGCEAHLVNRLDRETSGIVVVAKDGQTASELRRLWEQREVAKEYRAIVHGFVAGEQGVIEAPLGRDLSSEIAVKDTVCEGGLAAITEYRTESRLSRDEGDFSVLRVKPRTGRKHQIRIHLAHIGHAIVGDKLYGPNGDCYMALVENRLTDEQRARLILPWQALHAERLEFFWRQRVWKFEAPVEGWLVDFAP